MIYLLITLVILFAWIARILKKDIAETEVDNVYLRNRIKILQNEIFELNKQIRTNGIK